MGRPARRLAIYGKGGIGKSTITSNLSAAMADEGWQVLQIGCDPKQDSTRLLLEGRRIETVLDYLKSSRPGQRSLNHLVATGYGGVACVEAGGPEPGVGCAGRGILSAFELLAHLNIDERAFDVCLYDVLGDVVCGGFAVPLRREYAELVYIVTSGEFMSLYAANNILRGVRNFEAHGPRVGGLILNRRGIDDEDERVARFAGAVELPVVAAFPRSAIFATAEGAMKPVAAVAPDSELAGSFRKLAHKLMAEPERYRGNPLPPDELESVILAARRRAFAGRTGNAALPHSRPAPPPPTHNYCSKGVREHATLFGCAFNGAVHTSSQLSDAVVVVHGPRSCAFLSGIGTVSSIRRGWRRSGGRLPRALPADLVCSGMDERVLIFGGHDGLEDVLRRTAGRGYNAVFVATTCSSGIIGDHIDLAIARAADSLDGTRVVVLATDGDINGDYAQGVLDAAMRIAEVFIDPGCRPSGRCVNIVGEKNLVNQTDDNFGAVSRLLGELGIEVNCRFIRQTSSSEIAKFGRARLNLLAYDDLSGRTLRDFLVDRFQATFAASPFPTGFPQTERWLMEIAEVFECVEQARTLIQSHREIYKARVRALRPALEGKRLFVVTQNRHIDWIFDTALDLGMKIVRAGILDSAWDDALRTRHAGVVPFVAPYRREDRFDDLRELRPDLTLTDFHWGTGAGGARIAPIPYGIEAGFHGGLAAAGQWLAVLQTPALEAWRNDL